MKKTIQNRMIEMFTAHGFKEIPSRNKYRMMQREHAKNKTDKVYLFIGSNGAVRFNVNSLNAANSRSYTDKAKQRLELFEKNKA